MERTPGWCAARITHQHVSRDSIAQLHGSEEAGGGTAGGEMKCHTRNSRFSRILLLTFYLSCTVGPCVRTDRKSRAREKHTFAQLGSHVLLTDAQEWADMCTRLGRAVPPGHGGARLGAWGTAQQSTGAWPQKHQACVIAATHHILSATGGLRNSISEITCASS